MNKLKVGMFALATCLFAAAAFAGVPPEEDFVAAVPEPGTLGLLAAGIAAVVFVRLRGRK